MLRPLFHIHLMKTGGTSVTRLLHDLYPAAATYPTAQEPRTRRQQKFVPQLLLGSSHEERSRYRLISAHMPAWVADEFPDHLTATVLRDPVDRTISHLRQLKALPTTPDDLAVIYAEEPFRRRLRDYQTQLLSVTSDDHVHDRSATARHSPDQLARADRAEDLAEMRATFATCNAAPTAVDEVAFERARRRLDQIDVVGVTDDLPGFVARLADRIGAALPTPARTNTSEDGPSPPGLREQIEHDLRWDRKLYEVACGLT